MSAVFDERENFELHSSLKREFGDFTSFYIIISLCFVFGFFVFLLNIAFCCSRYREYWCDSNTGNRWILPVWTKTPHKQPPLDLTEIKEDFLVHSQLDADFEDNYSNFGHIPNEEYLGLTEHQPKRTRESDI